MTVKIEQKRSGAVKGTRHIRPLLSFLLCLLAFALLSRSDAEIDLSACEDIGEVMPVEFESFDVLACHDAPSVQTRAELVLEIPERDVISVADHVSAAYGMGELVFICCGYEPKAGRRGGYELTGPLSDPTPDGAYTFLTITIFAEGLRQHGAGGKTEFLSLGEVPAIMTLRIVDI